MKLVLVGLNAKYTHTCLSVRCLKSFTEDIADCVIKEYTINDTVGDICRDLYIESADCVAFSCYIWNVDMVYRISSTLKKANPNITIVLGGYEVMYDSVKILEEKSWVDAVIRGEGEVTFREYILALNGKKDISSVLGITYRQGEYVVSNPNRQTVSELDDLSFVYGEDIKEIKEKIIYYETSRGCPYGCTYCISGKDAKVRYLSVDRVKKELDFFMANGVKLVKFVDRTFNANPARAKEILRHIAKSQSDTAFHMELSGDIIDDEFVEIVSKAKKGKLRFEIGVQTTNANTMKAIERNVSFDKLSNAVKALMASGNVHIHLDLIAGLPYEDLSSFKKSFEDVITLRPNVLQLGFLKLLKGSKIRNQSALFEYQYLDYPPYEVICNKFVSYADILKIKTAEEALEKYYNSESFVNTMNCLFERFPSKFNLFFELGTRLNSRVGYAFSKKELFDVLYDFIGGEDFRCVEALKKDYLIAFRLGSRPRWFGESDASVMPKVYDMFRDEELKKTHFPEYYDVPAKEIMKHMYAERFTYGVLLFDYRQGKVRQIDEFLV